MRRRPRPNESSSSEDSDSELEAASAAAKIARERNNIENGLYRALFWEQQEEKKKAASKRARKSESPEADDAAVPEAAHDYWKKLSALRDGRGRRIVLASGNFWVRNFKMATLRSEDASLLFAQLPGDIIRRIAEFVESNGIPQSYNFYKTLLDNRFTSRVVVNRLLDIRKIIKDEDYPVPSDEVKQRSMARDALDAICWSEHARRNRVCCVCYRSSLGASHCDISGSRSFDNDGDLRFWACSTLGWRVRTSRYGPQPPIRAMCWVCFAIRSAEKGDRLVAAALRERSYLPAPLRLIKPSGESYSFYEPERRTWIEFKHYHINHRELERVKGAIDGLEEAIEKLKNQEGVLFVYSERFKGILVEQNWERFSQLNARLTEFDRSIRNDRWRELVPEVPFKRLPGLISAEYRRMHGQMRLIPVAGDPRIDNSTAHLLSPEDAYKMIRESSIRRKTEARQSGADGTKAEGAAIEVSSDESSEARSDE